MTLELNNRIWLLLQNTKRGELKIQLIGQEGLGGGNPVGEVSLHCVLKGGGGRNLVSVLNTKQRGGEARAKFWEMGAHG